mmetsp:Transcript_20575/g.57362  ORF Transcript_20575/g.57362 Transcript_20575/m.57362 type:complete len:109 (+) Transcript_20575:1992-2318(+)
MPSTTEAASHFPKNTAPDERPHACVSPSERPLASMHHIAFDRHDSYSFPTDCPSDGPMSVQHLMRSIDRPAAMWPYAHRLLSVCISNWFNLPMQHLPLLAARLSAHWP